MIIFNHFPDLKIIKNILQVEKYQYDDLSNAFENNGYNINKCF